MAYSIDMRTFKAGDRVRYRNIDMNPKIVGPVGTVERVYRGEPPEFATVRLTRGSVECRCAELEHA